jgi:MerR family transcriptional regulator, thiopeptide resistance regulator
MGPYTVKQLARLSGVSVRTLHHYDEIGLLKPAFTGENRYRYYGREEQLRLQDILFHRELGVPLADISRLLETEGRDRVAILAEHRGILAERMKRSRQLLRTIDRTIADLKGEGTMDDKDLYKGFDLARQAKYEEELSERLGEEGRKGIDASKAHWAGKGDDAFRAALEEGGAAEMALVERFRGGEAPDAPDLAATLERHRAWIGLMWGNKVCPPASYSGIADLYDSHPDFRARGEAHGAGFTDWLTTAMKAHAARLAS